MNWGLWILKCLKHLITAFVMLKRVKPVCVLSLYLARLHHIWISIKIRINLEFPGPWCHFFRLISVASFIHNNWSILSTPNWLYHFPLVFSHMQGGKPVVLLCRFYISPSTDEFCKLHSNIIRFKGAHCQQLQHSL